MDKHTRRLMQSFFKPDSEPYNETCWCPSADVYRGTDAWLVKFDLAGVRAEDVKLQADGRSLIVSGVRRDFSILEHQTAYSMEIAYNRFQRSVELPIDVSLADIRSEYRDGMLLVLIKPRSATS